jgi:hypothetical protein
MATTTTAAAGTFESHGEDFIHFINSSGAIVEAVNSNGTQIVQSGVTLAGQGNPLVVAAVSASLGFAVFNAAAPVTLVPTTAATGTYRVSLYGVTTTTFVTNTEETIQFGWTDDQGARTLTFTTAALTAGTTLVGSQLIRSVTGNAVTYTPNVTGSAATAGAMAVSIVVEQLI